MIQKTIPQKQSPRDQRNPDAEGSEWLLFSPRFKSLAAMAGWDEESIIVASLIVEDTPDRDSFKRRSDSHLKSPPSTHSRRKRRSQRSPFTVAVPVLNLDEEGTKSQEAEKMKKTEPKTTMNEETKKEVGDELNKEDPGVSCSTSVLPCIDKLREELSCAICLEICFEPSTTSCGHSFCKKCLRSAADKCGKKCPKCRQLISNGRSCTINTVLWNTIQLLFPQEVEARKAAAGALNGREPEHQNAETRINTNVRSRRSIHASGMSSRDTSVRRRETLNPDGESTLEQRWLLEEDFDRLPSRGTSWRRRRETPSQDEEASLTQRLQRENLSRRLLSSRDGSGGRRRRTPNQDEDAALAMRLQREEFMEAFRGGTQEQSRNNLSLARANLRAMASTAINIRMRNRPI